LIPLIDSYLQGVMKEKLSFLKANPELITKIFGTLSSKETLSSLTEFIMKRDIKVLLGFPREVQSLPCFIITIAGEQESPIGLGDNIDDYEQDYSETDILTQYVMDSTYMDSNYRVECWTDNGDLTSYMYTIAKWCLLSARKKMLSDGFILPKLSGSDLEPVPDYFTSFVYRRELIITFRYENLFFDTESKIGEDEGQVPVNTTIDNVNLVNTGYKLTGNGSDI